jgi:small-conductance mechanosensitive channel
VPRRPGEPDVGTMMEQMAKVTDELKLYTYLTGFGMLAFALTLIIVGYLLYKRRFQARKLTVTWAAAALVYLPIQMWVHVKIILPRTQAITEQMMKGMDQAAAGFMQGMSSVQSVGTVIFYLVFYAPFPILLLWLIGRASAKNDLLPAQMP